MFDYGGWTCLVAWCGVKQRLLSRMTLGSSPARVGKGAADLFRRLIHRLLLSLAMVSPKQFALNQPQFSDQR